ncbi:ATP-binding protein [Dokdonella sp.]|uniref:two-component system sensor histidine kinase NtrB n=1 Tax=Dokdonella sp. TaxID=2291710 RepID=UPI001B1F9C12|nr:ATP-binding protein [Dokdonella sp.]MBO9661311.1 PAS domain-containing protein [Dokdonella sp.]
MSDPVLAPEAPADALWAALESCATAMALVDRDLLLRTVNQSLHDWLGAGARSWRGERLALLDASPPRLNEAATRALAEQRRVWLRDARLRTAIGDRAADLALTPLDADTLLIELQSAPVDHSGLRLSESLRGFAHEVRGPLAGVRGAAQLLQRRLHEPDLVELAGLIVGEADRLAALSDGLLDTGAKSNRARINIHEVVERVAALLSAESETLRIRRDYDPSLPPLAADADRLQQACLNLARNAVEAGAQTLTVRTRVEHGARIGERSLRLALRVDLADDGRGVPAELVDTLFEPLVSGRADGTGLGLAIAREIAHEHGGEIAYVSRPGATVFTLLLPLGEAEA